MSLEEKTLNIVLSLLDLVQASLNTANNELLSAEISSSIASVSHASLVVNWYSKRITEYIHDNRFREYLHNLQKILHELSNILNHWSSRGKIRPPKDIVIPKFNVFTHFGTVNIKHFCLKFKIVGCVSL